MLDILNSLGLVTWDWDPALIRIGSHEIRYYGVLFALALAVGYMTFRWRYKEENEDPESATNFSYALMAAVIIGTRLVHCFFYDPDRYLADPIQILYFWQGGLASHGAGIGLILTCFIYDYVWRKTPPIISMDRIAFSIPFAMICIRLGNFFNSEIVGAPCDPNSPIAFIFTRYDMVPRYPSQLFEAGMGIIAGCIMFGTYYIFRKRGKKMPLGMSTGLIITSYFSMRFFVEFFKEYQIVEDGVLQSSGLREGQVLSIPFIIAGLTLLAMSIWGPWKNKYAEMYTQKYQLKKADPEAEATDDKADKADDKADKADDKADKAGDKAASTEDKKD